VTGPVLNKLRAFTMRPRVRRIIGQLEPNLVMRDVLARGGVLLVSLSTGLLGEEAALAARRAGSGGAVARHDGRAGLPQAEPPTGHGLSGRVATLPAPADADGHRLGRSSRVGPRYDSGPPVARPLPEDAREAVLANARSRVVFQLPASDARIITREPRRPAECQRPAGARRLRSVAQVFADGATQSPATGRTRPMPEATTDGRVLRERSRQKFGVDSTEGRSGAASPASIERRGRMRQSADAAADGGGHDRVPLAVPIALLNGSESSRRSASSGWNHQRLLKTNWSSGLSARIAGSRVLTLRAQLSERDLALLDDLRVACGCSGPPDRASALSRRLGADPGPPLPSTTSASDGRQAAAPLRATHRAACGPGRAASSTH